MQTRTTAARMALGCAAWAATVSSAWAQGSLTPPGAPAPTMRTLEQVQPRTPITNVPYTITQPGSYYLTANLTSTGHGVIVAASGVTLDLMGFTLAGDRGDSEYGVLLAGATNAPIREVVVRGGIIRDFSIGARAVCCQNSRFERLVAVSNANFGVVLNGRSGRCDGNRIADCTIGGNGSGGVVLDGSEGGRCDANTIFRCTADHISLYGAYGRCNGNTIADCAIGNGPHSGVFLQGLGGQCCGNTIAHCAIGGCAGYGVMLEGYEGRCDGNAIVGCTVSDNGFYGIHLWGSQGQCNGNRIAECTIGGNRQYGVYLDGSVGQCQGNTVGDCTIQRNGYTGISLYDANDNRVEGNHISGQIGSTTYGIHCSSTAGNLILCNTCVGQTTNFLMSAKDTYGPIVTNSGALATGGAAAHPWANFSR